jgi:hypothetical protein
VLLTLLAWCHVPSNSQAPDEEGLLVFSKDLGYSYGKVSTV